MSDTRARALLLIDEAEIEQNRGACLPWQARALKTLLRGVAEGDVNLQAALRLLDGDGHTYGKRPCQTCDAVSAIAARPFGCTARRQK